MSAPAEPVLTAERIAKSYPTPSGALSVLTNVSLAVARGSSVAIMGPSGSGKSTLLNILGALDRPTAGAVRIDGEDPYALSEDERAGLRNARIGFVFQAHHLLPQCSVLENVLIPALASSSGVTDEHLARARSLLERVGLAERLDHRPAALSGGECQRTAVVRALINQPRILLADEPTGNLDAQTAAALGDLFVELVTEAGVALVVATHSAVLAERFGATCRLEAGTLRPVP